MNTIKQFKGDSKTVPLKISDKNTDGVKTVFDLTGYTITLTIKKKKTDTDANAIYKADLTIVNAVDGECLINITPTISDGFPLGTHYFDIQVKNVTTERTTTAGLWVVEDKVID